jgi:colicin import membrane protein
MIDRRIHSDVLELAELVRPLWPAMSARLRASGVPTNAGPVPTPPAPDPTPPAPDPTPAPAPDPTPKPDGWTPPSKAEWDNLQRQNRETADTLKKLKDAEDERQRKADEEAGNHKAIAEREKQRADEAEARAKAAEEARQKDVRERRVEKIARRLKFRDPDDVMHRLSDDVLDDDSKVEKALKDLATEKAYLVENGETPRQRDVTGDGGGGGNGDGEGIGPDRLSRAYASSSGGKT